VASRRLSAFCAALTATTLLTGCAMARLHEASPGLYAQIDVARLPDGSSRVIVFSAHSRHRIFNARLRGPDRFWLLAGSRKLEVECALPGSSVVLHGGVYFDVAVKAGVRYELDCALPDGPHPKFLLRPVAG
jgi:hypothetical protein